MNRQQRTYILLILIFLLGGLYFTSWFSIAIEHRSGKPIGKLELENRFVQRTWTNLPADTVIIVKAFIPFNRLVRVRTESGGSIQHYAFTVENAYAGTRYNTLVIEEGVNRVSP